MSILICPVCGENLSKTEKSYTCTNRHSFDISKSGYVNLLLSKHVGKTVHGDNKLMVQARRNFLEKVDAGCGEGYYTSAVAKALPEARIYGIDISKTAADSAAKRKDGVTYAAASVFHIPVAENSCDMLITLFAPYCGEEFLRILKYDGVMIMAIPSEYHLWELKQAVYDTPYKNEVKPYALDGFELEENKRISYKITLDSPEDIRSLFSMTPYYYRTGAEQKARLEALQTLETQVDFELLVYRKV